MTKKKVTSTYRRQFSPQRSAGRLSAIENFDANFNYREYRRQVEHGHHKSPFVWDDWEFESDSVDEQQIYKPRLKRGVKLHNKSVGINAGSSDSDSERCPKTSPRDVRPRQRTPTSPTPSLPSSGSSSSQAHCDCGAEATQWRPKVQGQPARVLSDTISKTLKKVSKKSGQSEYGQRGATPIDDTPFTQFGTGDDELETGAKRTYNILSRHGVYPTAVDARQRFLSAKDVKMKQQAREGGVQPCRSKTTLHDPHFDNRMNRQTTRWQSEYRKHYRQFPQ